MSYNHKEIEQKWQQQWDEWKLYEARDDAPGGKKYILDMFPYPSGAGLHVGHPEGYTATDIYSRYLRMKGYNVLHPMGWDAFGLPAENYAIKSGVHPEESTNKNIETFRRQIKSLGLSYDWSRELSTAAPEYYKWTQWFFLFLYNNGLAYKKKANVNWCPSCQTVLAHEQVVNGLCDRCGSQVVQKDLAQWFFKITDYAERLLDGLDTVDWPQSIKSMQKNWIGKSEGAEIKFQVTSKKLQENAAITVFTTRPDTLYGATYMVLAPEHELVQQLKSEIKNWSEVEEYISNTSAKSELQRTGLNKEKTGVELQGIKAVNPANNEEIPVWIADYVLASYGTGAIMAVPGHDERDWEFAKKFNISLKEVVIKKVGQERDDAVRRDGVAAVVVKDKKYLVLYDKKTGEYRLPAGGYEKGETDKEALAREIREESGYLDFEVSSYLGQLQANFFTIDRNEYRLKYQKGYLVTLMSDRYQAPEGEEDKDRHDVLWLSYEEAIDKLTSNKYDCGEYEFVHRAEGKSPVCFTDVGVIINSGEFDGMASEDAKRAITEEVGGMMKTQYKLRDWLVSRQRYWGAPIPIVYDPQGNAHPVKEEHLPLTLPHDIDYKPKGTSPLGSSEEWKKKAEELYGEGWRFEIDTMDTFVCSSWYYFRFTDPCNEKEFASKENIKQWLPVNLYVGGAEHAVLHLLYARFFTKVLKDHGYIDFDEPFQKLRNQGMILAEDGRKMSKSLGNVINPDQVVEDVGADSLRLYEMFMGPLEETKPWQTRGIVGVRRFLEKVWALSTQMDTDKETDNHGLAPMLHKTIKKVTSDIESLSLNTAISAMMIFVNEAKEQGITKEQFGTFLTILAPFAPHLAEELWQRAGNTESIFKQTWPAYDESLIKEDEVTVGVQVNGKMRATVTIAVAADEAMVKEQVMANEQVQKWTADKELVKFIYVPGKIVNIVVK